jgi:hypothetical protein
MNMTLLERANEVLNSTDCLYSAAHYKRIIADLVAALSGSQTDGEEVSKREEAKETPDKEVA